MDVLKYKLKGYTLIETLTASVIIMIVFFIAMGILNNILIREIKNNEDAIVVELQELMYQYQSGKLVIPHTKIIEDWEINVSIEQTVNQQVVFFEATQEQEKKIITKELFYAEK